MMNILNGGQHADNAVDVQEFMVMPLGFERFSDAIRCGCEIFHNLKKVLQIEEAGDQRRRRGRLRPRPEEQRRGARPDHGGHRARPATSWASRSFIALDAAATRVLRRRQEDATRSTARRSTPPAWSTCTPSGSRSIPICSIEDGCAEDDWDGWKLMTERLGDKIQLVGDDLFVTNTKRLQRGIDEGIANSILIKVNQIGTLTETIEAIELARRNGYTSVTSHRSGETEDATIADLAVALGTGQIKTGSASRTDRMAKYNQLLRIEEMLGEAALYGGPLFPKKFDR